MANNPAAQEQLRALLASREVVYGQAQISVDTTAVGPARLADEIASRVELRPGAQMDEPT